jgi:hypothetical protein
MLKINRWSDNIFKLKFLRNKVFILRNQPRTHAKATQAIEQHIAPGYEAATELYGATLINR